MLGERKCEAGNGCERRANLVRYDCDEVALQPLGLLEAFDRGTLAVEKLRVLHRGRDRRNEHKDARAQLRRKRVVLRRVDLQHADGPASHYEPNPEEAPPLSPSPLPPPEASAPPA